MIVITFGLMAMSETRQPTEESARVLKAVMTNSVSVMSFNIFHNASNANRGIPNWDNRKNLLKLIIKVNEPDVVGLQEAYIWQVQELVSEIQTYNYIGVGRNDGDSSGESVSILYRKERFSVAESGHFWFSDTPNEASKGGDSWGNIDPPRMTTWVRLIEKSTAKCFYVYNTHLNHNGGADNPEHARMKSVQLLASRIADAHRSHPDDYYIITGDFNTTEETEPIRYIKGGQVCLPLNSDVCIYTSSPIRTFDTFRQLHPDSQKGTRCSNQDDNTGRRIDYILVWKGPSDTAYNSALCSGSACNGPGILEAKIIGKVRGSCASDHAAAMTVLGLPLGGEQFL